MEGPLQCLPGSLNRARQDLKAAFAQHFCELGHHDLVILLYPLFNGIQHFAAALKRIFAPW